MKYILLFFLVFFKFTPYPTSTTWDKDAGLILPFTQNARLSASSNPEQLLAILDGNRETSWQSGAPFPEAYIKRKDLNIFYKNEHSNFRGSKISNPNHLFDTDLNSHCQVHLTEGKAELKINLSKAGPSRFYSIKHRNTETIQINFVNENNKQV